ncbi:MAG: hypothetical protein ACREHD_19860 [Pirellulales bacterium]
MATTNSPDSESDQLRPEYDLAKLRGRVRGKYLARRDANAERLKEQPEFSGAVPGEECRGKLSQEDARSFIARMDAALMPLFAKCVLPIYGEHQGAAIQCGTGTLFRVADVAFLVTASHVTDLAAKKRAQLYITDAVAGSRGLALEGRLHSERNLDVSLWELPAHIVNQLSNRTFLTVHHADREHRRPEPGWYYLHGYPNCWSTADSEQQKTVVKPFTYGTVLYDGDTSRFEGYDPRIHVLLTAPRAGAVDSNGIGTEMPKALHGISGCSIWQAYYQGLETTHWTTDDAIVVAVQTCIYHEGTVVRGTRWWVINEMISKNYPALSGPLQIVLPQNANSVIDPLSPRF